MAASPRILIPEKANIGEVIEIKTLVSHIMETGLRKDKDGKTIPRNVINTFEAKFAGTTFFTAKLGSGTAANPYLAFYLKVPGPGELEFSWLDDEGTRIVETRSLNIS
jgi:sulfur-oxidizing protein SoxZ